MRTTNVIFPLETLVRELDYRLALAVKYLRPHHRIFVGESVQTFKLLSHLDGGLYVGKHLFYPWKNPHGPQAYDLAKARGFSVVHLSEEGAVFMGGEESTRLELDRQLDPETLADDDYVATWGAWQAEHYRARRPARAKNVRITGHPRFDLYRTDYRDIYQERVENIRRRFGNFVLINTNWLFALHPLGPDAIFTPREGYRVDDDENRAWFVSMWSRVARTVPAYIELVHRLSIKRKDLNFVFRPHPSDDPTLLRASFRGVPNVHVIHEGHVAPWILASRVMMHDGCTTGMEAYLLGRPIVNYQPVPDPETEVHLPNLFGVKCSNRDDAIEQVLAAADEPEKFAALVRATEIPEHAHRFFVNFREESFPRLLDVMREAERAVRSSDATPSRRRIVLDEAKSTAVERAKRLVRPFSRTRRLWAKASRVAFYGLRREEILPRLAVLEKLENKRVNCRFHSEKLIELSLGS